MKSSPIPAAETEACEAAGGAQPCSESDVLTIGWGLHVIVRAFGQWSTLTLADLPGGPRGYLVLAAVSQDLPRSQLALAQQLAIDKTAMTYLIDELETAGLVERRPDPADRRQRQIRLTDHGHVALKEFQSRLANVEERLLSALTPEEAPIFRQLLDRIAHSVQQEPFTAEHFVSNVESCDGPSE